MRRRAYLAGTAAGVAGALAGCGSLRGQSAADLDPEALARRTHELVNRQREEQGLSALGYDDELEAIAVAHSRDMYERDYFAHEDPDGDAWPARYEAAGYDCAVDLGDGRTATGGENLWQIAYSGRSFTEAEIAERCVTGWMNSPDHRENMLRGWWTVEGIGVFVADEDGQVHVNVTQNFC